MRRSVRIALATAGMAAAAGVGWGMFGGRPARPTQAPATPTRIAGETIRVGADVPPQVAASIVASEPATRVPVEKWISHIARVPSPGDLYLATVQELPNPEVQDARLVLMSVRESATELGRTDPVTSWALEPAFVAAGGRLLVLVATQVAGRHSGYEVLEIVNRSMLHRLGGVLAGTPQGAALPLAAFAAVARGGRLVLRIESEPHCWTRADPQPRPMPAPVRIAVGARALAAGPCVVP